MGSAGFIGTKYAVRVGPAVVIVALVFFWLITGVFASTPPQQPQITVTVGDQTVHPGSGIDVSVVWTQNAAPNPVPPGNIDISLFSIPGGTLAGTYTIYGTEINNDGITRQFRGTIPGSVLPAGAYTLVATDPVSGETGRTDVNILEPGGAYQAYRSRQAMDTAFFPVAAILIGGLAILLAAMVVKRQ